MIDTPPSPPQIAADANNAAALVGAVLFAARLFGQAAQTEQLRTLLGTAGGTATAGALDEALAHAGLVGTSIDAARGVKASLLPALVVGAQGQALVVTQTRDGRYECHRPGTDGLSWIDRAALDAECPSARWLAVRPVLFFDQRSLLYTLPQPTRWFWDVFGRNRWIFGWALLGTLMLNLFGALLPFFSMAVYDRVIPNNATDSLWVLSVAAVLLIAFEMSMRMVRGYLVESAARRMDVALSAQVFAQCLRMRAANRPASGGVLANIVRDFEAVREFFASSTLAMVGDLPFTLLYLVLIALIGGWLVVVPLAAIPLLLGLAWLVRGPLSRRVAESMQESSQRTAHLFETMNGLDTVKALGAEAWSRRKWENLTVAIANNTLHTRELVTHASHASAALLAFTNVVVVAVGAVMIGEQALSMGQLIGVTMLTARALAPVGAIATLIVRWQQTRLSFQALNSIMASPTDDTGTSLQAPPLSGRIEFRDVTFAYPNTPPLLDKLNLRVQRGERIGIIGKLGSGKTTLLRLLLNQYGPQSGSVLFDDLVSTQLDPLSLRRQLGFVPQDVTLFHGTIRENIELGRTQGEDAALLAAIRTACLDDIIQQLPAGIATQVGERGDRLSGGQRQAVAIARALLSHPPVLLLDEPSSMMDPGTEQRLIARLRELKDTTLLLVTHRMAMLPLVDRLIVMDRGRVIADGPRDDVLRALAAGPVAHTGAPSPVREAA